MMDEIIALIMLAVLMAMSGFGILVLSSFAIDFLLKKIKQEWRMNNDFLLHLLMTYHYKKAIKYDEKFKYHCQKHEVLFNKKYEKTPVFLQKVFNTKKGEETQ